MALSKGQRKKAVRGKGPGERGGSRERKLGPDRYDSDDSWLVTSSEMAEAARAQQSEYLQALDIDVTIGAGGKGAKSRWVGGRVPGGL